MKKYIVLLSIIILFFSCISVGDWENEPVLSTNTIELAKKFSTEYYIYTSLMDLKTEVKTNEDISVEQLDKLLLIEKKVILSSKLVADSWFEFNLGLRQDPGFQKAYKEHYYFKKAIDALSLNSKYNINSEKSVSDAKVIEEIKTLEDECRIILAMIVSENSIDISIVNKYKTLKKLYKSVK